MMTAILVAVIPLASDAQNTFPSSGNAGIGTTSPNSRLQVINSYSTPAVNAFTINAPGSGSGSIGDFLKISVDAIGPPFNIPEQPRFIVKSDGKVGIGIASPTTLLDVNGAIKSTTLTTTSTISAGSSITSSSSITANGLISTTSIGFRANNLDFFFRTGSDVNHGIGWRGSGNPFAGNSIIDGPVAFGWSGGALGTTAGGQKISLRWNSNQEVYVPGKMVVGTLAPNGSFSGYKMAVDGDLVAKKVIVQTSSWADYVFADDYNLASLEEVEAFIKVNKHLPEIPSEEHVLEKGIDTGEMNRLLLKKVEELTLHLIAQQKKIDELYKK